MHFLALAVGEAWQGARDRLPGPPDQAGVGGRAPPDDDDRGLAAVGHALRHVAE